MNNEFNADEIKARYTIYEILSKYGLYPQRNNMIACPFHNEKNASMKIYDNNTFHCFGCGASGDVIKFVEKFESLDFYDACKKLAEYAGIELPEYHSDENLVKIKKKRAINLKKK